MHVKREKNTRFHFIFIAIIFAVIIIIIDIIFYEHMDAVALKTVLGECAECGSSRQR